ncbi:MAG: hypothetical protein KA715_11430 [Xanthomonadaceae bacterium]|nr:hypothetical protein [Xanthomonadaceae bacterium]
MLIEIFEGLLKARGFSLDPMSNFVWMPKETRYQVFYEGDCILAFLAEPQFELLSKALHAPDKNRYLIENYFAAEPVDEFFDLCTKYEVDLQRFVK